MFLTETNAMEILTANMAFAPITNATKSKVIMTLLISVALSAMLPWNVNPRRSTARLLLENANVVRTLTEIFTVLNSRMITMERNITNH